MSFALVDVPKEAEVISQIISKTLKTGMLLSLIHI